MNLPWRRRAQRRHKALDGRRRIEVSGAVLRPLDEIRAEWLSIAAKARSAVYYVDGNQVGSLADVRAALKDGETHAVHMVSGEPSPELLTGPFGREDQS